MTGLYSIIAAGAAIVGAMGGSAATFAGIYYTYQAKIKELSVLQEKNRGDGALAMIGRLQEEVKLEREGLQSERTRNNEMSTKVDDLQKKYAILNEEVISLRQRQEETSKLEGANKRLEIENNNLRRDLGREKELRVNEQTFFRELQERYREACEDNAKFINGTHPSQSNHGTNGK